jgi:hypothetical protein
MLLEAGLVPTTAPDQRLWLSRVIINIFAYEGRNVLWVVQG